MSYKLVIPGLAEAVAAVPVVDRHAPLLQAVRLFEPLRLVKLAVMRNEGARLLKRKVLNPHGELIHENHQEWLRDELAADGGRADNTRARLQGKGYLLTESLIKDLHLVHDRGGEVQSNFLQVCIRIEEEWVERELFTEAGWRAPCDLNELIRDCDDSYSCQLFNGEQRRRYRPASYSVRDAVDVARFIEEAEDLESKQRAAVKKRQFEVTNPHGGEVWMMTADEMSPGWDRYPVKARRLFDDWAASSAGRSGARICDHWTMHTSSYTDAMGARSLSLVPGWILDKKMAKIPGDKYNVYELYGKLEKLSQRVKVPFGWYFFMLHGNRVDDDAGRRILDAAEEGLIVLPEHDYRVLKRWRTNPYGF